MVQYLDKQFDSEKSSLKFILTTPTSFDKSEKLPLMVFLHGAGERGEDLNAIKRYCIPKLFTNNQDYNGMRAITLSPLCPVERTWYDYKWQVISLIKQIAEEYNVDTDRISLSGISMGGFGTWEIAMQAPELFSAIAPVCGGGMNWRAWYVRNLPIRVYHGRLDDVVPIAQSETMVNSVRVHGGSVDFTIYDDLGHCCWDRAFEETDLISWLANAKKQ